MLSELTTRQINIIEAIKDITLENGNPPTIREVGNEVGLSSSSTIMGHLIMLKNRGIVDWEDGKPRTLHLINKEEEALV
ncbi:LexA family protein [Peribacillus huizhouensis]|uniref:Repressor LexA n=1 Tax=Peribacillus huizhouensis TaxID=1501239 RepID=A0ABR6CIK9_9BACI|nr:transcriptional regulator [Peribacillus huizhouensis]MBA9024746.1 repressor LexA [Peribacillus huizhouensis]